MSLTWTKRWSPADDGTTLKGADLRNLQDDIDSYVTTNPTAGVVTITGTQTITGAKTFTNATFLTTGTFTNTDLVSGTLPIVDTAGLSTPFQRYIMVYENTGKVLFPDDIVLASNSWYLDLTSYGTISGTWGWAQIK
jgi:hypothetical protein